MATVDTSGAFLICLVVKSRVCRRRAVFACEEVLPLGVGESSYLRRISSRLAESPACEHRLEQTAADCQETAANCSEEMERKSRRAETDESEHEHSKQEGVGPYPGEVDPDLRVDPRCFSVHC